MRVLFLLFFLNVSFFCLSQGEKDYTSARNIALADISTTLVGNMSSIDNQGTLALVDSASISLAYRNNYLLSQLSTYGLGAIYPTKVGTWAAQLTRFGNSNYSQNTMGLAYGKALNPRFSFGMRLNISRLQQNEYGNVSYPTIELGFLTKVSKELSIGVQAYNPLRSKVKTLDKRDFRIASNMKIGVNYSIEKVNLMLELENNTRQKMALLAGVEYHANNLLDLRLGFNYPNKQISTGLGFKTNHFLFDFYYTRHIVLGGSMGTTITYAF